MQTFVSSKGNDPIYSKVLDDILCMEIFTFSLSFYMKQYWKKKDGDLFLGSIEIDY